MSKQTKSICLAIMTATLLASTVGAIDQVSRRQGRRQPPIYGPRTTTQAFTAAQNRLGVFELYGAFSAPTGYISHLGNIDFRNIYRPINFNASDVYKTSPTLGVTIGTVRMGHWYSSVGFQYTHLRVKDTIVSPFGDSAIAFNYTDFPKPNFNQYEVRLNSNWQFYDVEAIGWSPYVGMGLGVGTISQTLLGYDSQTELNIGLAMNFGAEVRIWQDPNGSNMVTLASANSWEFAGSGYRPKSLTLGVALKIYSHL